MTSHILLVEDEESLAMGLQYNLREEGYHVTWATDGQQALDFFSHGSFDLVILDIMLPYMDGYAVAQEIRKKDPQLPVLMLTARVETRDRIRGLEVGADDYLTKPFHLKELLLRIKGMLKRKEWYKNAAQETPVFQFAGNKINFSDLTAVTDKGTIQLTAYEAMLLKYLVENRDRVISRKELLENVWNINPDVETRTIDNFISRLRKYFEPDPDNPAYIISIRGTGYRFCEEPA